MEARHEARAQQGRGSEIRARLEEVEDLTATQGRQMSLKKSLLRAAIIYSIDMAAAILGWTYGFGLEVKNWPALIGVMLGLRFITHMLWVMSACDDAAKLEKAKSP